MKSEDIKKIKCDRCDVIVGLHCHSTGWRCPSCIWNERENLIAWARNLLNTITYTSILDDTKPVVVVSRKSMDALAEVVKEATS